MRILHELVERTGWNRDQFCFKLTVTDIATGWMNRSVPNKAQKWVFAALQYALGRFPEGVSLSV